MEMMFTFMSLAILSALVSGIAFLAWVLFYVVGAVEARVKSRKIMVNTLIMTIIFGVIMAANGSA